MIKKLISIFLTLFFHLSAFGSIQIFPTSVVLIDESNKGSLTVRNTGQTNVEYKISAVYFEMDKEGKLHELEKNEALKAPRSGTRFIKFSPKKIILGPKEEQVFRFILDIPKAQAKNNYRLHLKFTPITTEELKENPSEKISFSLDAKLALAINITYFGNTKELKVELDDLEFIKKAKIASTRFKFKLSGADDFIIGKIQLIEKNKDNTEDIRKTVLGFSSYVKNRTIKIDLLESERCSNEKMCLIRFTPSEILNLPSVDLAPK